MLRRISMKDVLFKKGEVIRGLSYWGLVCTDFPYLIPKGTPKSQFTREYFDEDGAYVYYPQTQRYDGLNFNIKVAYDGDKNDAMDKIGSFMNFISSGEFSIYSQAISVGRDKVRLVSVNDRVSIHIEGDRVLPEFTLSFRTEDNTKNISL